MCRNFFNFFSDNLKYILPTSRADARHDFAERFAEFPNSVPIADDFRSDLNSGIYRRLQVELGHYQQARNWIGQFSTVLRTLDALHLAIGHGYQMKVVTGDIGLAKSGQIFGVDVELVIP